MSNPQDMRDLFKSSREAWLEGARSVARELLRSKWTITIEDVLKLHPRPGFLHKNTVGSVFKTDMFKPIGFTQAKKLSSHKRVIRVWTFSDKYREEYNGGNSEGRPLGGEL